MNNLRLGNRAMMAVAARTKMRQGLAREQIARRGWAYTAEQPKGGIGGCDVALVDLSENLSPDGILSMPAAVPDKILLALKCGIRASVTADNADPKPFRWTKSANDMLDAMQRCCARTRQFEETTEPGH